MKMVPVGKKGRFSKVDDSDYDHVMRFTWYEKARSDGKKIYAHRRTKDGRSESLARFLLQPSLGYVVDHIDGDTLNDQRSNLRVATTTENVRNKGLTVRMDQHSRYKGVGYRKENPFRPWYARIVVNRKVHFLGYFREECNAAQAYNFAALEHFGEYARFNEAAK